LLSQTVRSFQTEKIVAWIFLAQLSRQRQRLRETLLLFVYSDEQNLGIVARPLTLVRDPLERLNSALLRAMCSGDTCQHLHGQRQGAHDVVIHPNSQLSIMKVRIQLYHATLSVDTI